MRSLAGAFALLLLLAGSAVGQTAQDTTQQPPGAPVVLHGDTLWVVRAPLGPFTPQDRAAAVLARLTRLARVPGASRDSVRVVDEGATTSILVGDIVVTTITEADAAAAGKSRAALATEVVPMIRQVLERESVWGILRTAAIGLLETVLATLVLLVAVKLLNRLVPAATARIESWRGSRIPTLRLQRLELLSASRLTDLLILAVKVIRVAVVVILLFWYIPLVFSFFPWTEGFANRLFDYVATPLRALWVAVTGYIPNLFYLAVIVVATRYGLRFVRLFFDGLERGTLQFRGFYPEWARPTYKIVQVLVFAFALVVAFPYLPGSESSAFKGVSVFLGVLLSLGSAGAIGNVVAGVVLTYMRPFAIGDRVRIADTVGDVIERTLLVTRVQTPKQVEITIPNAMVLASHIINYSAAAQDGGVILHTSVTIGYDAPWRKVHELLIAAAGHTEGVLPEPKPFVLQTALNDFYVSYELNVYTERPNEMPRIYSDLHQHIQDAFNEAGVEIMSPHYGALRDGNRIAMPDAYVPKTYQTPGWRFPLGGAKPVPPAPPEL
jgi:small-conductance mechanosensitive channel